MKKLANIAILAVLVCIAWFIVRRILRPLMRFAVNVALTIVVVIVMLVVFYMVTNKGKGKK